MLRFHHLGCLVENIDEAIENYRKLYSINFNAKKIFVSSQLVNVCFIELPGANGFIELIEPTDSQSIVSRLKSKGITYYHIGYTVQNIKETISSLENLNFKVVNIFNSEAFDGKLCSFVYTPDSHLIELIEE